MALTALMQRLLSPTKSAFVFKLYLAYQGDSPLIL